MHTIWDLIYLSMPEDASWAKKISEARTMAEIKFRERELENWEDWSPDEGSQNVPPWWDAGLEEAVAVARACAAQFQAHAGAPEVVQEYTEFGVVDAALSVWGAHVWTNDQNLLHISPNYEEQRRRDFIQLVRNVVDKEMKGLYLAAWKRKSAGPTDTPPTVLRNPPSGKRATTASQAAVIESKPAGGTTTRARPGPKPNKDEARRVRTAVRELCGEDWEHGWDHPSTVDSVADVLDEIKAIRPRTWSTREPPLRTWADALEQEKPIFLKAVKAYLRRAKIGEQ